ncbi:MAG: hypothetical protein KJN71_01410 [Acidimicrobiia bacterium]|nr:hypothetical protein [Acidimicrobiia bacterium]NNC74271.1 hypothetical protein [Acidimicrobiia bacterium]
MDITYDSDAATETELGARIEKLADVDPADAPPAAEAIADELAANLEEAGAVLEPVQLPLDEDAS